MCSSVWAGGRGEAAKRAEMRAGGGAEKRADGERWTAGPVRGGCRGLFPSPESPAQRSALSAQRPQPAPRLRRDTVVAQRSALIPAPLGTPNFPRPHPRLLPVLPSEPRHGWLRASRTCFPRMQRAPRPLSPAVAAALKSITEPGSSPQSLEESLGDPLHNSFPSSTSGSVCVRPSVLQVTSSNL